jgi:hypothetical protein
MFVEKREVPSIGSFRRSVVATTPRNVTSGSLDHPYTGRARARRGNVDRVPGVVWDEYPADDSISLNDDDDEKILARRDSP